MYLLEQLNEYPGPLQLDTAARIVLLTQLNGSDESQPKTFAE